HPEHSHQRLPLRADHLGDGGVIRCVRRTSTPEQEREDEPISPRGIRLFKNSLVVISVALLAAGRGGAIVTKVKGRCGVFRRAKGSPGTEKARYASGEPALILSSRAAVCQLLMSGAWTRKVLHPIERHPNVEAASLARRMGVEKEWLKANIRKLKNLGLTISHRRGYGPSPRGKASSST
ncbi:MAG TPA: hypothetical protein VLD67_05400, partial [Vicinamibacterales bacterium]|nr:hypothetical protein [Vicinamibacterales bacterium]